jgi:hypothetical protein
MLQRGQDFFLEKSPDAQSVVEQHFDDPAVQRAVDGTLTAILGREAALRGVRLTMDELLKENRKLEVDLSGLKV